MNSMISLMTAAVMAAQSAQHERMPDDAPAPLPGPHHRADPVTKRKRKAVKAARRINRRKK